jgi:hypothetical protein
MHWKFTANVIQLWMIESTAFFPLLLILLWPVKAGFIFEGIVIFSFITVGFLVFISRRGITTKAALGLYKAKFSSWIGGGYRPIGVPLEFKRRAMRSRKNI